MAASLVVGFRGLNSRITCSTSLIRTSNIAGQQCRIRCLYGGSSKLDSNRSFISTRCSMPPFNAKTGPSASVLSGCGKKLCQLQKALFNTDSDGSIQNQEGHRRKLLKLMDCPNIIFPHVIKYIRNFFFTFLIKTSYDTGFSQTSFLEGSQQAVTAVAEMVSAGRFEEMEGLVTHEAIGEIKRNYAELNLKQRQFLIVNPDDIFMKFVYEIGMIFDDETGRRFVEIMGVFHGLHGLAKIQMEQSLADIQEEIKKNQDNVYVCNYRFRREFVKGEESGEWTINLLNHFSAKEVKDNTSIFTR